MQVFGLTKAEEILKELEAVTDQGVPAAINPLEPNMDGAPSRSEHGADMPLAIDRVHHDSVIPGGSVSIEDSSPTSNDDDGGSIYMRPEFKPAYNTASWTFTPLLLRN